MNTPDIAEEMKSLLGLSGYVSGMIPNCEETSEGQGSLLVRTGDILYGIFQSDPKNHTEMAVDASPLGIGTFLAQRSYSS